MLILNQKSVVDMLCGFLTTIKLLLGNGNKNEGHEMIEMIDYQRLNVQ